MKRLPLRTGETFYEHDTENMSWPIRIVYGVG